ncbi:PKD repeat protein [Algoriphagus sp. 4150]|uniref:PKD domain-containing protein n=1 Tax=Algoriphagus sp. 4150 TaxID=2817756 RepID=UPI0028624C16|nr:PKD domain-containing protein [Algoriphagus sp. 4150]MDR7130069.1 PKD repeat protein [Algoriphagus sp. 4150]
MKKLYIVVILFVVFMQNVFAQSESETETKKEQLRLEMEQRTKEEIETLSAYYASFIDSDMNSSQGDEVSKSSNMATQNSAMSAPAVSPAEFNALIALYNSAGGPDWTNSTGWTDSGSPQNVNGWHGITVDAAGHVIGLNLSNNNLVGTVPSSISGLSYLETLNLGRNHLTGPIPASLGNFPLLIQLNLNDNQFTGMIPSGLGSLGRLLFLDISYNPQLDSTIPPQLGNLSKLLVLFLSYSNLTGGIPDTFRNLTSLRTLHLAGNKLTGPIIQDINLMASLQTLHLGANELDGPIPFSLLSLPRLEYLSLYENEFTGSIPGFPGETPAFTELRSFEVYDNELSGTIPRWLGEQKMLQSFNIAYNGFTGELPSGLMGEGSNKSEFRINNNPGLKGKLPAKVSAVLGVVDISNCNFTFIDFLSVHRSFIGRQFIYAPQAPVDVQKNFTERIGFKFNFEATVDRNLGIAFPSATYKWYKIVNGNEVLMQDGSPRYSFRYTTPYLTDSDYGTYFYTITHSNAPLLTLRSRNQVLSKNTASLGTVGFNAFNVFCAVGFEPELNLIEGCTPLSYEWTFGDGNSSADRTPVNAYASNGIYSVTLKVNFKCGDTILFTLSNTGSINFQAGQISENDLETVTYEVRVPTSEQVISSSVQTYADNWVKNFKNVDLSNLSDFQNGKSGVWNPLASYFYDGDRSYTDQPDLSADGTYDLKGFSYINPDQDMDNGWVLGAQNNSYSEEGFADEAVDGLGIYSSNLYGYKGSNVIASASNARQNEILVTDFEDPDAGVIGNWRISHKVKSKAKPVSVDTRFGKFMIVVNAPMDEIADFSSIVLLNHDETYRFPPKLEIYCKQPHPDNPNRTILVVPNGSIPGNQGFYSGGAFLTISLDTPETLVFDSQFAHTGSKSMKIVNPTESITQDLLSLESAKKYSFSSWISNGQSTNSLISDPNQFIELIFENAAGTAISSTKFHPSSHTIEKWRKVEGDFVVPAGTKRIQTKFSKGASTAMWIDDVRIMPSDAMMKSYVYDPVTLRLLSILDEENFATTYFYDEEGNLRLLKKETDSGIVTITEVEQFLKTN